MASIAAILRRDPNTGAANLLAFAEWLVRPNMPCTLIDIQLSQPPKVATLRWLALLLREELSGTLYLLGDTQFVVVDEVTAADPTNDVERLQALFVRQAQRLDLTALPIIQCHRIDRDSDPATILQKLTPDTAAPGALLNRLITQLAALGATLADQTQFDHDPVTGLFNGIAARQQLAAIMSDMLAQNASCSILLINGDDLRRYNNLGYAAGDQMITDLATALREQLRPSDVLARWDSGDRFLVILPRTTISGAATLAERLRQRVLERSQLWPLPVTISIGIASAPQHGRNVETVLAIATSALAQAKAIGKNRVVVGREG
ncbi:MAG: GGDEF domain-containing protein [Chloroflexus sp.]|uniref:GGDEF domain-containing protein n=1 Tax=Chloroflexus sp. TaxID=1904827 RepID=UPI0021DD426A|nr:GGDEF domain-containing protein [Chloroflexus sp.]GIV88793.1 MAG: GGDEF domain-containing protein [Chloroflexus sp.]